MSIHKVLFVQDGTPCIRNIKYAEALSSRGIEVHLMHRGNEPQVTYGFGNEFYTGISKLPKSDSQAIAQIAGRCRAEHIDILHYHNYPDRLCARMLKANIGIPIIYDQHDFMSLKMRNFSVWRRYYERKCNECNQGAIYITENYRDLVAQRYKINPLNLIYPNYGSAAAIPSEKDLLPPITSGNNEVHLVYVGHITQHKGYVRYLLDLFKTLSERGFIIHIYPMRNKKYDKYKAIRNVVVHSKLPAQTLISEISQYHYGIAFLNSLNVNSRRKQEVRYGFWNKMLDYIMAGVPPITFEYYQDMSQFLTDNKVGVVCKSLEELTPETLGDIDLVAMRRRILQSRENMTCSKHIQDLIDFYLKVKDEAHVS